MMKELSTLKEDIQIYQKLETQKEEIELMIEMGYEENDASVIPEIQDMLDEFQAVAKAKGIVLSDGIAAQVVDQMERIPTDTTTSMQRDFRAHRSTELESLTGYIVREGKRLDVPTPTYDRMYAGLLQR